MTGLPNQTIISTEKNPGESGRFFSCLNLAPLWNCTSQPQCAQGSNVIPIIPKTGWRNYPCSPCALMHSPLVQEAGNLACILSLRGLDSRIPTSQKSPVTSRSVLLGQINLHPSCCRWVRVNYDRSSQRVNKKTPDAVLSWGKHAAGEMGYSCLPKSLGYRLHSRESQQQRFMENLPSLFRDLIPKQKHFGCKRYSEFCFLFPSKSVLS